MKKQGLIGGSVAVILALVAAWWLGWFSGKTYSDDPKVAELEKMRDEAVANMPAGERPRDNPEFRQRWEGLTPEQRQAFWESSAPIFVPMFMKQFEQRYDEFMAMSPEEQQKKLDEEIDKLEARGGAGAGRGGGGGPPNVDPKKAAEFMKKMNAWTTPQQRAKFENGVRMFNERRKERGLAPVGGPGGGGFY
jgi:hypothetical protein